MYQMYHNLLEKLRLGQIKSGGFGLGLESAQTMNKMRHIQSQSVDLGLYTGQFMEEINRLNSIIQDLKKEIENLKIKRDENLIEGECGKV